MFMRSMWFKFAVASVFWAITAVAWAAISSPSPAGFHFSKSANLTVQGNDANPSLHGSNGTISATRTDAQLLQSCGFYTNASNGNFQKSSSDADAPVLNAPQNGWPGGGTTVQIWAFLNDGTNVGFTYGISD